MIKQATSEVKHFRKWFGSRPIDSIRPVEVEQHKKDCLSGALARSSPRLGDLVDEAADEI